MKSLMIKAAKAAGKVVLKDYGKIKKLKYNVFQLFTKNPRSKNASSISHEDKEFNKLNNFVKKNNYKVFSHSAYPVNFTSSNIDYMSVASVVKDIQYLKKINGIGTVIHVGHTKYVPNLSWEEVAKNIEKHLVSIVTKLNSLGIINYKLILENRAKTKTGNLFLTSVDDMIKINKLIEENKILKDKTGICFDTCHDFVSTSKEDGENREGVGVNLKRLFEECGKSIICVHLNDSKSETLDRHEDIFKGLIPPEELVCVIKFCKKNKIPMIIERHKASEEEKIKMLKLVNKF